MKAITTDVSSSISDTGASLTMEPGATFDKVYKKVITFAFRIKGQLNLEKNIGPNIWNLRGLKVENTLRNNMGLCFILGVIVL